MSLSDIDVVFEGGGARGLALNGAVAALEEHGYRFKRLVGTSAGAISATLVAAGYSGAELREVSLEKDARGRSRMMEFIGTPRGFSDEDLAGSGLGRFLQAVDVPLVPESFERRMDSALLRRLMALPFFPNFFSLVEHGGYFSAKGFESWLEEKLDKDGRGMSRLSFRELHERTGVHLSMVVTDTDRSSMLVLNHLTVPDCPVLWGVRMSMSIPFFWPEVIWQKEWGYYQGTVDVTDDAIVDGGVLSNFALRLLVSDEDWVHEVMGGAPNPEQQVLGLYLDDKLDVPGAPPPHRKLHARTHGDPVHGRLLDRVEKLLNTVLSGNDMMVIDRHPDLVCRLPVKDYGVVEFQMSDERIVALVDGGAAAVRSWLDQREVPAQTVSGARRMLKAGV